MSTQVVVGVDGSEQAEAALSFVQELARAVPAPVFHLVHAFYVPINEAITYPYYEGLLTQLREDGNEILNRGARRLEGKPVVTHLREGVPASQILAVADEVGAQLIAVGSQGKTGAARLFLGSVSAQVAHAAKLPVVVVKGTENKAVQRVLIGVDGSAHSQRALEFAAAWLPRADLVAMNVAHVTPETRVLLKESGTSLDAALRAGREAVAKTIEAARLSTERVTLKRAIGTPVEELVAESRLGSYDLVLVGSRGLGRLGELLLGSVSEGLVRLAPCPVAVIK